MVMLDEKSCMSVLNFLEIHAKVVVTKPKMSASRRAGLTCQWATGGKNDLRAPIEHHPHMSPQPNFSRSHYLAI